MIRIIKPWFAPQVQSLTEVPMALIQVAIVGGIGGPLIGLLLGWLFIPAVAQTTTLLPFRLGEWLRFAVPGGATYGLVFYSVFGLGFRYVRLHYQLSYRMFWLSGFAAWIVALLLLSLTLPGGEWFGEAVRARSVRILVPMTCVLIFIGLVRAALERANAQKAAAEARAQVKALKAQINPHFFFNTLNTIYALIAVNPEAAQRTVGLLADMSRHAFNTAQADLIPLAQELEFANAYLDIERIRFGDRLQCEMLGLAKVEGLNVPALSVQPLVENAVRHGIARRREGGRVSVEVGRNDGHFWLIVSNDCPSSPERSMDEFFREGHALENIRERLALHYGDRASIDVSFPRPDAVEVKLKGPAQ